MNPRRKNKADHYESEMSEPAAAFFLFMEIMQRARLNAAEGARILGITRSTWYNWTTRKMEPYPTRLPRIRRATKLLRADLAEKSLPALTGPSRRVHVSVLISKLVADAENGN